jgi:hypothetical protein
MLEQYEIRLCRKEEAAQLREFIGSHWKTDHVLALSQELLDWQHFDSETGTYNFVVAEHRSTGAFHAAYGFIPVSHFDSGLKRYADYWPAIWKVREDVEAPGLGMFVYYYFVKERKPRNLSGFGMNPELAPLARRISYRMGSLDHFYMVNEAKREFELLDGFDGRYVSPESTASPRRVLNRYEGTELHGLADRLSYRPTERDVPTKSLVYLENRFCRHPIYDYHIYTVESGDTLEGVLVTRVASHAESRALRIVDFFGEPRSLEGCRNALQGLLECYDAEYADFYNLGLDHSALARAGFLMRNPADETVVPNYFEPFERRNIRLDYVIYTDVSKYRFSFVKGDCDQDRPNRINRVAAD